MDRQRIDLRAAAGQPHVAGGLYQLPVRRWLSLMGAAAWIALRERPPLVRMGVLAVFAMALCAVHLFACGVLGVIVAASSWPF